MKQAKIVDCQVHSKDKVPEVTKTCNIATCQINRSDLVRWT